MEHVDSAFPDRCTKKKNTHDLASANLPEDKLFFPPFREVTERINRPTVFYGNTFSNDELAVINETLVREGQRRPTSASVSISFSGQNAIHEIVAPKVKPYLPDEEHNWGIGFFLMLDSSGPHIDNPLGSSTGRPCAYQFLVPTQIVGNRPSARVVMFDQHFFGLEKNALFKLPAENREEWHELRRRYFKAYREQPENFDAVARECLAVMDPELFTGLSVQKCLEYRVGDMIGFSTSRIHTTASMVSDEAVLKVIMQIRVHVGERVTN